MAEASSSPPLASMAARQGRWAAIVHTMHSPPLTPMEVVAAIAGGCRVPTESGGCPIVAAVLREVPVLLAVDVVLQPGVSVLRCAALAHAQHMLACYRLAAVAEVDEGSLWPVGGSPRAVQCVVAVNGATPPAATPASAAIVDVGGATAAQSAAPPAGESRADGGAWSAQPAPATAPDGWMLAACSTVGSPPACTSILIHRDEPAASLYHRLVAAWPASATAGLAGLLAWHATAQGFVPLRGDAVTPAAASLHVDPSQPSPSEVWIAVPAAGGLAQAWASWLPQFTPSPPPPPAAAAGPWSASAPLDARAPPWRPASTRGVPAAAFAGWPAVDHAGAGPLYGMVGVGGSRSRQADGGGLHPRTLAGLAHLRECAATMARTSDLDDGDGWAAVVDLAQLREALQALCDATFGDKGMSMRMGSRTAATTPTDGVREALFDAGVVTEATTVLAHVPHASTVHRQVLEQAIQLCTNIAFNSRAQLAMAAPDQQVTSVLCRRMVADGDCPEIQIKVARCLSTLAFENPPGVDHIIACGAVAASCTALRRHAHHSFAVEKVTALLTAIEPSPSFQTAAGACDLRRALVEVAGVEWAARSVRGGHVRSTLLHLAHRLEGEAGGEGEVYGAAHHPSAAQSTASPHPPHDPFRARFHPRGGGDTRHSRMPADLEDQVGRAAPPSYDASSSATSPTGRPLPGTPFIMAPHRDAPTAAADGAAFAMHASGDAAAAAAAAWMRGPSYPSSPASLMPAHMSSAAASRVSWASAPAAAPTLHLPAAASGPAVGGSSGGGSSGVGSGTITPYMPSWGALAGSRGF